MIGNHNHEERMKLIKAENVSSGKLWLCFCQKRFIGRMENGNVVHIWYLLLFIKATVIFRISKTPDLKMKIKCKFKNILIIL